jgi:hypothetical protein
MKERKAAGKEIGRLDEHAARGLLARSDAGGGFPVAEGPMGTWA